MSNLTLSSEFYVWSGVDGYVIPGTITQNTDWWSLGDNSNGYLNLDPGATVKVSSVELSLAPAFTFVTHKELAEVGCLVQQCRDSDTSYYHFTITNVGMQGVRLNFGSPFVHLF